MEVLYVKGCWRKEECVTIDLSRKEQALLLGTGCGSSFVVASSLEFVLYNIWWDWGMESEEWEWSPFHVLQFWHFSLCCQCQNLALLWQRTLKRLGVYYLLLDLGELFAYTTWKVTAGQSNLWYPYVSLKCPWMISPYYCQHTFSTWFLRVVQNCECRGMWAWGSKCGKLVCQQWYCSVILFEQWFDFIVKSNFCSIYAPFYPGFTTLKNNANLLITKCSARNCVCRATMSV